MAKPKKRAKVRPKRAKPRGRRAAVRAKARKVSKSARGKAVKPMVAGAKPQHGAAHPFLLDDEVNVVTHLSISLMLFVFISKSDAVTAFWRQFNA